jgi:recombinational DNA repair protein RecT
MPNELMTIVNEKQTALWALRASYMPKNIDIDMYFKRSLINILENKDLAQMSQTKDGAGKIIQCLAKALQMGLQIGGVIPQAYVVAMYTKDGMKPTLIPTIDGYRFVALSDPPILKDFFISAVYEKEVDKGFRIDMPNGKVEGHFVYMGVDRGKLIGVYAILTHLNGTTTAGWMPRQDIDNVRNNHSPSYKAFKAGKMPSDKCAWETDYDMMAIKTAGKRFLEPYVALKEGLQMVLNTDDEEISNGNGEPDNRNIQQRVGSKLDSIIEAETVPEMKAETGQPAETNTEKPKPSDTQENKPDTKQEPKEGNKKDGELF